MMTKNEILLQQLTNQQTLNGTIDMSVPNQALLVAIPCLNEAETIEEVIHNIPRSIEGISRVDVLVVDDGSTDATALIAKKSGAHVIQHTINLGLGAAFKSARQYAIEHHYEFMVIIDGDRQFDSKDIPLLLAPILSGHADMVTASRFINKKMIPKMPIIKLIGNYWMSILISLLVRHRYYDVSCGFRCYHRETLLNLELKGTFNFSQETFLECSIKNLRIVEIPIHVKYFKHRQSRVAGNLWIYTIKTLTIIWQRVHQQGILHWLKK